MNNVPRGLYAITSDHLADEGRLAAAVGDAIAGGAVMVQYRSKRSDAARRRTEATELLALCRHHGVPLLINDDVDLARAIGADGVHLGREDVPLAEARRALGGQAIIGVSCYDRLELAEAAAAAGADYVAFGSFFPSAVKPDAVRAEPWLISEAKRRLGVPVAAIGGITPDNCAELVAAGADLLAVISALFAGDDCRQAARSISGRFSGPT